MFCLLIRVQALANAMSVTIKMGLIQAAKSSTCCTITLAAGLPAVLGQVAPSDHPQLRCLHLDDIALEAHKQCTTQTLSIQSAHQ
jgi:hypothetical protein